MITFRWNIPVALNALLMIILAISPTHGNPYRGTLECYQCTERNLDGVPEDSDCLLGPAVTARKNCEATTKLMASKFGVDEDSPDISPACYTIHQFKKKESGEEQHVGVFKGCALQGRWGVRDCLNRLNFPQNDECAPIKSDNDYKKSLLECFGKASKAHSSSTTTLAPSPVNENNNENNENNAGAGDGNERNLGESGNDKMIFRMCLCGRDLCNIGNGTASNGNRITPFTSQSRPSTGIILQSLAVLIWMLTTSIS